MCLCLSNTASFVLHAFGALAAPDARGPRRVLQTRDPETRAAISQGDTYDVSYYSSKINVYPILVPTHDYTYPNYLNKNDIVSGLAAGRRPVRY